jgi:hypothetical protein
MTIKWLRIKNLRQLQRGNIVRNRGTGQSYVVDSTGGDRVTAVTSIELTSPDEWEVVQQESSVAYDEKFPAQSKAT